jgi:ornithine cyclodeaminase/thiomorpholine-carboxylate dehydrogenase
MDVLILDRAAVQRLLDPAALLAALRVAFAGLTDGHVTAPPRNEVALLDDEAFLLAMPGRARHGLVTVKVVTVVESNLERGLPSHLATIGLYDPQTGACRAFMDGTFITAIRTSAAAALACDLVARRDARVLALVGAGVQGEHHLRMFPLVREFHEIRIASLVHEDAERLAACDERARAVRSVRDAVRGADVVALATHAGEPVVRPEWIAPGSHVSSVGYRPPLGELPLELVRSGTLFVETRQAFAPPPTGCAELQGLDPGRATELGEVLLGRARGRRDADEITVYKAMGHVAEDIAAAELVHEAAVAAGAGRTMPL